MYVQNYWRRKLLRKIARRNGWQTYCGLCGGYLTLNEATVDHITPRSLGGSDHTSNLQMAHGVCNRLKGNKLAPVLNAPMMFSNHSVDLYEVFCALEI